MSRHNRDTRNVTVVDLVTVRRKVKIPNECPACGTDLTGENCLRKWEFMDSPSIGRLSKDDNDENFGLEEEFEHSHTGNTGDDNIGPVAFYCQCGHDLVEGYKVHLEANHPDGVVRDRAIEIILQDGADESNPPLCCVCEVPMVLRTAKHGANKGNRFWGCKNFPKCRELISVRDRELYDIKSRVVEAMADKPKPAPAPIAKKVEENPYNLQEEITKMVTFVAHLPMQYMSMELQREARERLYALERAAGRKPG